MVPVSAMMFAVLCDIEIKDSPPCAILLYLESETTTIEGGTLTLRLSFLITIFTLVSVPQSFLVLITLQRNVDIT